MRLGLAARGQVAARALGAGCKTRQTARAPQPEGCACQRHTHAARPCLPDRALHLPMPSTLRPLPCAPPLTRPYQPEYAPRLYQAPAISPGRWRHRLRLAPIAAGRRKPRSGHPARRYARPHGGLSGRHVAFRSLLEPMRFGVLLLPPRRGRRPVHPSGCAGQGAWPQHWAHQPLPQNRPNATHRPRAKPAAGPAIIVFAMSPLARARQSRLATSAAIKVANR